MPLIINWDRQQTQAITGQFDVRIRTGYSRRIANIKTRLQLSNPRDAQGFENTILRQAESASQSLRVGDLARPNVPELVYLRIQTSQGEQPVCIVWGIVLNGSRRQGLLQGEYRFVVIHADELDACLSRIFNLEKVLTPQEQQIHA